MRQTCSQEGAFTKLFAPNGILLSNHGGGRTALKSACNAEGTAIQTQVYEVGKRHDFPDLRAWFKALYEILLGQDQGPRINPPVPPTRV